MAGDHQTTADLGMKHMAAALGAVAAFLALAGTALATNGMFLTSYGPETLGRGGANLAISDRTLAVNFNPAGISQLQGNHFSVGLAVLAPKLDYRNSINGCVYFETLSAYGAPELGTIFCALDNFVFDEVSPYIRWERTQTIARGGELCDFRFYPKETYDAGR